MTRLAGAHASQRLGTFQCALPLSPQGTFLHPKTWFLKSGTQLGLGKVASLVAQALAVSGEDTESGLPQEVEVAFPLSMRIHDDVAYPIQSSK
jgi:hypothetical protein